MKCVVIGAGITGLAAAYELRKRGVDTSLYEASPRAGGKIESRREGELLLESGPQGFLDRVGALTRLAEELRLTPIDALPAARRRAVAFGGRLCDVPMDPISLVATRLLTLRGKARLLGDLILPRGTRADESVAAFARRRLGPEAADHIFFPLVSGLYAGDADSISLPAAFPSLAALEREHRSVILGAARSFLRSRMLGTRLRTFAAGMEELTRALAERVQPALSSPVTQLRFNEKWHVTVENRGEVTADAILLALPAHAATRLLRSIAPHAADAAAAIPYVPVTLAWAAYPERELPRPLDRYGFLTAPDERGQLLGAVFASAAFPDRAPKGSALISARLGGARHPEVTQMSDDDLALLVHRELRTLIEARSEPSFFLPIRHAQALPQYTIGHEERVRTIERHLPAGLFIAGAGYRGAGVPDCVRSATDVADRISRFNRAARASLPRSPSWIRVEEPAPSAGR
jgi:oxygen-dependent protoporphyrinogen oxidase